MVNNKPAIAIVDYGMGNLFSVEQACLQVGADAVITHDREQILKSDAVILPGVGAFGDAMSMMRKLDLIAVLREVAHSPRPLMGICLGMQLMMSVSFEFGEHEGLNIIPGQVIPFQRPRTPEGRILKVPQVQWNHVRKSQSGDGPDPWAGTLLQGLRNNVFLYFVHSYYVVLEDKSCCLSTTTYGDITFSSSAQFKNNFVCQFHPEKSGVQGLKIYQNLIEMLKTSPQGKTHVQAN